MSDLTTYENSDGHWISEREHCRIIAEKDREITHLQDVYTKQRFKLEDAYQQLLEKAIRFASLVEDEHWIVGTDERAATDFLKSSEVQAWKEQQS